jgi:hypothetical protein
MLLLWPILFADSLVPLNLETGSHRRNYDFLPFLVTFMKCVTPRLPFVRPEPTVAALLHRDHSAAD